MFHKTPLQHYLAQGTGWAFLVGITTWIAVLMQGAAVMRAQTTDSTHDVIIGPFLLNTYVKKVHGEGFQAAITFEQGLLWYLLVCTLVGAVIGLLLLTRSRTN